MSKLQKYIAAKLCEASRRDMEEEVGKDVAAWYEHISIPEGLYLVCETSRCKYPVDEVDELRKLAVSQWLPSSGYVLREAPEIGVIHWYWKKAMSSATIPATAKFGFPLQRNSKQIAAL